MNAFERLYSGLDREGPGLAEDVFWALDRLEIRGEVKVCDAGCGSGADARTLGAALPDGDVEAIEQMPHLAREAEERCAALANVVVHQGDMAALPGYYDMIWCAGALYFLGVTEGLRLWRSHLAPGAAVAFSEPVRTQPPGDAQEEAFWGGEDTPLTDLDGIRTRVEAAGYQVIDSRRIIGEPWKAYYRSLAARIITLADDPDPEMQAVLAESWREVSNWRAAPGKIAYELVLARPV